MQIFDCTGVSTPTPCIVQGSPVNVEFPKVTTEA